MQKYRVIHGKIDASRIFYTKRDGFQISVVESVIEKSKYSKDYVMGEKLYAS